MTEHYFDPCFYQSSTFNKKKLIDDIRKDFKISHWLLFIWVKFVWKFFLYQNNISPTHPSTDIPVNLSTAGHPHTTHPTRQWFLPFNTDYLEIITSNSRKHNHWKDWNCFFYCEFTLWKRKVRGIEQNMGENMEIKMSEATLRKLFIKDCKRLVKIM